MLLTHIHLDHASATGALVRRWPDLRVYVSEVGAPHLVEPKKLLESAGRLYGPENMERLWGEVLPVPAANVVALEGGEEVEGFRVEHVPGHAGHHVCWLDLDEGDAYVGDMAGVRIPPGEFTVAPTPPPEIDVEAWLDSLERIEALRPQRLRLTHFGRRRGRRRAARARPRERCALQAEAAKGRRSRAFPRAARVADRRRHRSGDRAQPASRRARRTSSGRAWSATGASAARPRPLRSRTASEIPRPILLRLGGVEGGAAATLRTQMIDRPKLNRIAIAALAAGSLALAASALRRGHGLQQRLLLAGEVPRDRALRRRQALRQEVPARRAR